MKTTEIVDSLVRGKIAEMGYELDEVEYVKECGNMVLTLYIDSENGVTIDDCEKVSRAIDPILDENDPIEEAYYLSVSSIGIDRPLKKDKDFERNMGKKLQVKLYAPINKKKELLGVLTEYDGESFTISVEKTGEVTIKRKDAALIRPWIDFE
ncbi:MAG: ribosome maturation factor RimP [Christensenellaceae bacterium]|nr:ribosome maturation factor RimP [Christensenellaceae bacterium]